MKTVKVAEATNTQLDWLVAKCEGFDAMAYEIRRKAQYRPNCPAATKWSPTTNWSQMGPIIERELLMLEPWFHSAGYEHPDGLWVWRAYILGPENLDDSHEQEGTTPLIAAARCFVASKLGDTVEVPDELS